MPSCKASLPGQRAFKMSQLRSSKPTHLLCGLPTAPNLVHTGLKDDTSLIIVDHDKADDGVVWARGAASKGKTHKGRKE